MCFGKLAFHFLEISSFVHCRYFICHVLGYKKIIIIRLFKNFNVSLKMNFHSVPKSLSSIFYWFWNIFGRLWYTWWVPLKIFLGIIILWLISSMRAKFDKKILPSGAIRLKRPRLIANYSSFVLFFSFILFFLLNFLRRLTGFIRMTFSNANVCVFIFISVLKNASKKILFKCHFKFD